MTGILKSFIFYFAIFLKLVPLAASGLFAKIIPDGAEEYTWDGKGQLEDLADDLKKHPSLKKLDLSGRQIDAEGASILADVLKINTRLEVLNISLNKIGEEGVMTLTCALNENKSLKNLDLSGNQVGTNGILALSDLLKTNDSLEVLSLKANKIDDTSAQMLADALKSNNCLKELFLNENQIGEEGIEALKDALRVNYRLEVLDLGIWSFVTNPRSIATSTSDVEMDFAGELINMTGETLLVYGPKIPNSPVDNALYRLPNGRRTPPGWDCDGFYVPNNCFADQALSNLRGPLAIKYVSTRTPCIWSPSQGTYACAFNNGAFRPNSINWPIPDISSLAIDSYPEVPNHISQPNPRGRWEYEGGYFIDLGGGRWKERAGGSTARFIEQHRTTVYIKLFDSSRDIGVVLYPDRMTLKQPGSSQFNFFRKGQFEAS